MKRKFLILISITLILSGCNDDECGECFTPPEGFIFEIADKTSGENLFTNGTYKPEQIQITNSLDDAPREFTFILENNVNLIHVNSIGWETETVNLKIAISDDHIFDFHVDAERMKGDCCSYTEYKNVSINDAEFLLNPNSGIYTILVE